MPRAGLELLHRLFSSEVWGGEVPALSWAGVRPRRTPLIYICQGLAGFDGNVLPLSGHPAPPAFRGPVFRMGGACLNES